MFNNWRGYVGCGLLLMAVLIDSASHLLSVLSDACFIGAGGFMIYLATKPEKKGE